MEPFRGRQYDGKVLALASVSGWLPWDIEAGLAACAEGLLGIRQWLSQRGYRTEMCNGRPRGPFHVAKVVTGGKISYVATDDDGVVLGGNGDQALSDYDDVVWALGVWRPN